MRKPVIGVMGGAIVTDDVYAMATELGRLVAERGWVLLNGGRNNGVMAASAAGASAAGGTVIGILPDRTTDAASPDLDIAVVTGLGDGRNVINVLSSDVVVACPGGLGTLSEIALALKNGKPVIVLARRVERELEPFFTSGRLQLAKSPDEAVAIAVDILARRAPTVQSDLRTEPESR
jgi:hypothetical protein